jgi:outer membrane lipoprotein SlyB
VSVDHTPKDEVLEEQCSQDAEIAGVGGAAIGGAQTRDHPPGKTTESGAVKTAVAGSAIGSSEPVKAGVYNSLDVCSTS